jgi:phage I-like protein
MVTRSFLSLAGLALNFEGASAPDWVQLTPPGPVLRGRDGRAWTMRDPQKVVDRFARNGADLPIDVEHASQIKAEAGEPAPAVGWMKELEARNGEIWARVEWTAAGADSVTSRAYRYLSPVLKYDGQTGEVVGIASAGLTNLPNLHLAALNSEQPAQSETAMDKVVLEALGLKPEATAAEAVVAITRLKESEQIALNRAATPDPEKFVPKADHLLALNRITAFEQADKVRQDAEVAAVVEEAIKAGKVAPASKDYHLASCRAEGGLQRFKDFVASAPVIAASPELDKRDPKDKATALNAEELAMCRMMGVSEEVFAAEKAAQAKKE